MSSGRVLGPCFKCKGTGRLIFATAPEQRARNRANAAARKVRKAAEALEAFRAEYPDVYAWMDGNTFGFAVSLREAVTRFGYLTENQIAAARRCIAKRDAAATERAVRIAAAPVVDMTKIEAALATAGTALKMPKLRLAGMVVYPARSKPGTLYVRGAASDDGDRAYLGKITGGRFFRARDCSDEQEATLLAAAADPLAAAVAYGRLTGRCSCCGAELTNAESIARGIGPICATRYGF